MHAIAVILANKNITMEISDRFILAKSIELPQDIGLVPVTDGLNDELVELIDKADILYEEFEYLNKSVIEVLEDVSSLGEVSYIETDYFGGTGAQSSIVWKNRKVIYGPNLSSNTDTNPINDALKILGVRIIKRHDEFDEVGLGRYRSTEKWFERGCS